MHNTKNRSYHIPKDILFVSITFPPNIMHYNCKTNNAKKQVQNKSLSRVAPSLDIRT